MLIYIFKVDSIWLYVKEGVRKILLFWYFYHLKKALVVREIISLLCWLREKNDFWQLTLVSLKTYAIWYYSGYGSEAAMIFSCANGHKLHGAPSVHCSILGEWGAEQPTCKCESPLHSPVLILLLSGYLWHPWLHRAWPNCWIWAQLWRFSGHYMQARFQTSR